MNSQRKEITAHYIVYVRGAIALLEHVTQNARNSKSKPIKTESGRSGGRFFEVFRFGNTNPRIVAEHQDSFDVTKQGFPKPHELLPTDTCHWHSSIVLQRDHERALGPRCSVWTTRIYRLRKPTTYYIAPLIITDICGWGNGVCVLSPRPLFADTNRLLSITTALQNVSSRWIVKQQGGLEGNKGKCLSLRYILDDHCFRVLYAL